MSAAVSLLLLLFAEVAAPTGNPQAKSKAQSLLKQGTALYTHGDFAAALEKFEAAYRIYPSAKLQFNIGQADRELGRPLEAFQAFEKFLASSPDAAPEILAEARQSDTELRAKLGQVKIVSASVGVEVTLDGKSVGTTPIAEPIWTVPGPHEVALQRPGARPVSVDVSAGSEAVASLDPSRARVAKRGGDPDRRRGRHGARHAGEPARMVGPPALVCLDGRRRDGRLRGQRDRRWVSRRTVSTIRT